MLVAALLKAKRPYPLELLGYGRYFKEGTAIDPTAQRPRCQCREKVLLY